MLLNTGHQIEALAYCLMSNYIHLILKLAIEDGFAKSFKVCAHML